MDCKQVNFFALKFLNRSFNEAVVEVEVSNLKQQSTESRSLLQKNNWNAELCVDQWATSAGQHERGGQFPWLTFWGKIGIIFLNIPIMANHQEGQRQCERGDTRHTVGKKKTNRWRAGNNFLTRGTVQQKSLSAPDYEQIKCKLIFSLTQQFVCLNSDLMKVYTLLYKYRMKQYDRLS